MTKKFKFQLNSGQYTFCDPDGNIIKSRKGIPMSTDVKEIAALLITDLNQVYSWKGEEMKLNDSLICVLMEKKITFNILPVRLKDENRSDLFQMFDYEYDKPFSFIDEFNELDYYAFDLLGSVFGVHWVDIIYWMCSNISTPEFIHRSLEFLEPADEDFENYPFIDFRELKTEKMKVFSNFRKYLNFERESYYHSFPVKIKGYGVETIKSNKPVIKKLENFYWLDSREKAIKKALSIQKSANSYKGIKFYIEYIRIGQSQVEEVMRHFILSGKRMQSDEILTALDKESKLMDLAGKKYEIMNTTAGDVIYNAVNQFHTSLYYFTA